MSKEELEKAIEILKKPIAVTKEQYFYFKWEDYETLKSAYEVSVKVLDYLETLLANDKEVI